MKKRARRESKAASRAKSRHASSALAIGLDLGGTNVRAGLVSSSGKILKLVASSSNAGERRARVLDAMAGVVSKVFDKRIAGIGVGVPGHVVGGRIVKLHNIPDLDGADIKAFLEKKFRKPVTVTNDAKCFALAETRFGQGKGAKRVVGAILGTGCGCGVVLDGKIYGGRDNLAGELGMVHYRATIIEDYVAGKFIRLRAEELKLPDTEPEAVAQYAAGKHLMTHAEEVRLEQRTLATPHDVQAVARKIFDELGYHLGYLLSIIIRAYNPDIIVLGGGVSKAHGHFWKAMRQSLELNQEYPVILSTKIVVSRMEEAGVVGAAALAFPDRNQ